MAVKVIVPSKTYNERAFGVQFVNGEAVFKDEKLAKDIASALGYEVQKLAEDKPKAPAKKQPVKKETKKVEE